MKWSVSRSLLGATLAALMASLCCIVPLLFLLLGISGIGLSTLTRFEPLRPYAIGITLLLLGIAFWQLYITLHRCTTCTQSPRWQRGLFWLVSLLSIGLLSVPWFY